MNPDGGVASTDEPWPRAIDIPDASIRRFRFAPDDSGAAMLTLAPADSGEGDRLAAWRDTSRSAIRVPAPNGSIRDALALPAEKALVATRGALVEIDVTSGAAGTRGRFVGDDAYELATDRAGAVIALSLAGESAPLAVVDAGRVRTFGPPPDRSFSPMFPNVALSLDGRWAALSCGFDDLYLVEVSTGAVEHVPVASVVPPHPSIPDPVALQGALGLVGKYTRRIWLSSNGDRLVAAGMIPYRSYAPAMCLRIVGRSVAGFRDSYVGMDSTFTAIDLTPDLAICVTSEGQSRDAVTVRDTDTGQTIGRIDHPGENIAEARFSWDGSRLALAGGGRAFVHRFQTRRWRDRASTNGIWYLTIDDRPTMAAVGDADFTAQIHDRVRDSGDWTGAVALAEKLTAH
jgi:hypothetical protein